MFSSCGIMVVEDSHIGEVRRTAAQLGREIGGSEEFCGRLGIVVVEAATNLVRHAGGGEMVLRKLRPEEGGGIDILALDRGPGMRSVTECLRDGFSSGGTAGNGLGAIRRVADQFEITSTPGKGTAIWCRLRLPPGATPPSGAGWIFGAVNVALASEEVCGDCWGVLVEKSNLRVMVADGLGHGVLAHEAARAAVAVLRREPTKPLCEVMATAHEQLRQTRGAAVALVEVRPGAGTIAECAVGNIALRVVREKASQHMISNRGTVGGNTWAAQEFSYPWEPEALLVLHSDGLSTHWNLDDHPGLIHRHPGLIAGVLYRDHRRERDDATVVVLKFRRP